MNRYFNRFPVLEKIVRHYSLFLIAFSLIVLFFFLYSNRRFYHDDAYITLRYADNFIHGHGIVWNTGEFVQVYTNFFYLLLISLFGFFGFDLHLASRIVPVAAFCLMAGFLSMFPVYLEKPRPPHPLYLFPLLIVLTSAPLAIWMLGGLEGMVLCFLTLTGVLTFIVAVEKEYSLLFSLSSILLSLVTLTRPDAGIFLFVSFLFVLCSGSKNWFHRMIAFLSPCLLIMIPYLLWARFYYGDYLPNTFYSKVSGLSSVRILSGFMYLKNYLLLPPYLNLFICLSFVYCLIKRKISASILYVSSLLVVYTCFIIFVGGDHMAGFRLLLPTIPLAACLLYFIFTKIISPHNSYAIVAIYCTFLVLSVSQIFYDPLKALPEDPASRVGTIVGKYIASHWPKNSLIALNTAGSTPYYASDNMYIDMLGLNDRHIAQRKIESYVVPWQYVPGHAKGDGKYVLSRKPDYIIIGPAEGTSFDHPWFLSDWEISLDSNFQNTYQIHQVFINSDTYTDRLLFTYYQRVQS